MKDEKKVIELLIHTVQEVAVEIYLFDYVAVISDLNSMTTRERHESHDRFFMGLMIPFVRVILFQLEIITTQPIG